MASNKKSSVVQGLLAVVLVGGALFALWYFNGRVAAGGAEVGDCLNAENKLVECSESGAAYRVVGRLEGIHDCDAFPSATSRYTQFTSRGGEARNQLTLCLADM